MENEEKTLYDHNAKVGENYRYKDRLGKKYKVIKVNEYGTYDLYSYSRDRVFKNYGNYGLFIKCESDGIFTKSEAEAVDNTPQTWTEDRGPQMGFAKEKSIYKYEITKYDKPVMMPTGAHIIRTETDGDDRTWVWAIVDLKIDMEARYFRKIPVPALENFNISMSNSDTILAIEHIGGFTHMWIEEDESNEYRKMTNFRAFKTGAEFDIDRRDYYYVGFYPLFIQMELGLYVFKEL